MYEKNPLPMSREELIVQGIDQLDFIIVTGDAYIDHPSFGTAIIGRVLQSNGYSVGVIAQPDWKSAAGFQTLGRPRLAFLVTAGNLDSMVNHYSVMKRRRSDDAYTPGGQKGQRPDRAAIVYANRCKEAFRGVPVLLGGLEASLRRFAHYDYWDDAVRHSILVDSGADLLLYGMAETAVVEVADALHAGLPMAEITYVAGTGFYCADLSRVHEYTLIESFLQVSADKQAYARAFMAEYREQDAIRGKRLAQAHEKGFVVINPPAMPLAQSQLDGIYALPYTRKPHPRYRLHIPALDEVEFSLTSCRGCFGACSFCALTFHQGRVVQARSHTSLVEEAKKLTAMPGFKGYLHDVGGPTANFRKPACPKQLKSGTCPDKQCIGFTRCTRLEVDHDDYLMLLRKLRALPGIKKVFVRSGVRYDYIMYDKGSDFLQELVEHHVSGRLKVAPEHVDERVLYYMNKPASGLYDRFLQRYAAVNKALEHEQFVVPYFISSHPGSDIRAAVELAEYLHKTGQRPEQVQDFYPTPGTLSTCMYYTGLDPRTMQPMYIPRDKQEKEMQRALMQYYLPRNYTIVRKALLLADREDLIGHHKGALVPEPMLRGISQQATNTPGRPKPKGTGAAKNGTRKGSAHRKPRQ